MDLFVKYAERSYFRILYSVNNVVLLLTGKRSLMTICVLMFFLLPTGKIVGQKYVEVGKTEKPE